MEGVGLVPFQADSTYMTWGIAGVFLFGLVYAAFGKWGTVEWIADKLVFLGLLGTVLGFIIALSGVDPATVGEASAIAPMVARLIDGMGTALHTTLVGAIGYVWLDLNQRLTE